MEIYRKINEELDKWKKEYQGSKSFYIYGVRRTGKTYSALSFAMKNFESYIKIDFSTLPNKLLSHFEKVKNTRSSLDLFYKMLQTIKNTELKENNSVIIFDNCEMYDRSKEIGEYIVNDNKYYFIGIGLSNENKRENEIAYNMHSLDFSEFMITKGEKETLEKIKYAYDNLSPMDDIEHTKAIKCYEEYIFNGQNLEYLSKCLENENVLNFNDDYRKELISNLKKDIGKYSPSRQKTNNIYSRIPATLTKKDKTFSISVVGAYEHLKDYVDCFNYLNDNEIINMCYRLKEFDKTSLENIDNKKFKCYMDDTGILLYSLFLNKIMKEEELSHEIEMENIGLKEEMLAESAVARDLRHNGHMLYSYVFTFENSIKKNDISFVIENDDKLDIYKVSTSNVNPNIIKKFKDLNNQKINRTYILSKENLNIKEDIIYLPIYMAHLI